MIGCNLLVALALAVEPQSTASILCDSPSTRDIVACLAQQRDEAHATLDKYLAEVRRLFGSDAEDMRALSTAQEAWTKFVEADCQAQYQHWIEGTIREPMFVGCQLNHATTRVHQVWSTYLDRMATDLPEPRRP